jgi:hypothetical protein
MLQRVNLRIQSRQDPEQNWEGYLVLTEQGKQTMSFFSDRKISPGEQVTVVALGSTPQRLSVEVSSCHDQVSSGRVMRESATPEKPYTTRNVYRCNGKHQALEPAAVPEASMEAAPVVEAAKEHEATPEDSSVAA